MARTRIKICGVRDSDTALAAADAGADAVGFVFIRSSPRCISPDEAANILLDLPTFVTTVGVFMNHAPETFMDIEEECPTSHSQLHGNEDEHVVRACGPVIKAVRYSAETIAGELARWDECEDVEAILIDGPAPGEGVAFTWSDLVPHTQRLSKPFILAGGLNHENVGEAIRVLGPWAVDVSSGVEKAKGVKDADLIEAFCDAVRKADA